MTESEIIEYELKGPEIGVTYNYFEGEFDTIKGELLKKIKELKVKNYIKIGKSSTPNERYTGEYKLNGFEKMIVIYKSDKEIDIEAAEREMLKEFIDDLDVLNINEGSGGPLGDFPHYLYLVSVDYDAFPGEIVKMILQKFETYKKDKK